MQFTVCSNDGMSTCMLNNKWVFSGTRKGIQPVNSAIHIKVYWPNHGRDNPHTKLKWLLCRCTWVGRFLNMLQQHQSMHSLHFAWVVDNAKCMLVKHVCVSLSLAAFPHYCTDLDLNWGNGKGCPLVVHIWADLQSVHGFRCYDNRAGCEMSASACTRSMPGFNFVQAPGTDQFLTSSTIWHKKLRNVMVVGHGQRVDKINLTLTRPSLAFSWAFWYWLTSFASLFSRLDSTSSHPSDSSSCATSSLLSAWHRVTQSTPAFLYSVFSRHCLLTTSTQNSWTADCMSSSWRQSHADYTCESNDQATGC